MSILGLWLSTRESPLPRVGKPITNYSAGFCSLICRIVSLVHTKFDSREGLFLPPPPPCQSLSSRGGGGGEEEVPHHVSQNCVFIIKSHYGQGLNVLWTDWMTTEDSCYPVSLTPTVTEKQITTTLGASFHRMMLLSINNDTLKSNDSAHFHSVDETRLIHLNKPYLLHETR